MSDYKPRVGDRVRITVTGEVTSAESGGFWVKDLSEDRISGTAIAIPARPSAVVSVEKITEPLPTMPGSVIRLSGGFLYVRLGDGRWQSLASENRYPSDEFDQSSSVQVIFDAGAGA